MLEIRGHGRMSRWFPRSADAVTALALGLLPFVIHAPALLPGRVMSPAGLVLETYPWRGLVPGGMSLNPTLTDVAVMFHPWVIYAGQEVRQGRFPLWNPYAFAGVPFFGNPQTALLFPLTALAYVLPAGVAITLGAVLKHVVAGTGMYWFLRRMSAGPGAALVGAVTFMLNGSLAVWLQWSNATPGVLLPWLLGAVEEVRAVPCRSRAIGLAAIVALTVFAGYPQGALLNLLVLTAWALYRLPGAVRPGGFLLRVAAGVVGGLGVAAVQVLPALEYIGESAVAAYRAEWMPYLHLPGRTAIALLMPFYYGSPVTGDFWGPWNFNEISVSVGVVPWILGPAAVWVGRGLPGVRFFAGVAAVSAAVLYGLPVAPALMGLPGLALLIGFRAAPLLVFALSALTGLGLGAVARAGPWAGHVVAAVKVTLAALIALSLTSIVVDYPTMVGLGLAVPPVAQYVACLVSLMLAALLVLRLAGTGMARGPAWLLAGLQVAGLTPLVATYHPVQEARWLYPSTPVVRHLQQAVAREPGRVLLAANISMLYGLRDASGYDGMTPQRFDRMVRPGGAFTLMGNGGLGVVDIFESPVLDLLAVRRVVVPPGAAISEAGFALEYAGVDARVYRNERALPRAWLVPGGRCVADRTALDLLSRRAADLRREVLLGDCREAPPGGRAAEGPSRVRLHDAEPHRTVVEVDSPGPAYLVLSDAWFPGWSVEVDGSEAPLLRANYAFRAVRLEGGPHRVEFVYQPGSVRVGLAVTLLALVACGLAVGWPRRRHRP